MNKLLLLLLLIVDCCYGIETNMFCEIVNVQFLTVTQVRDSC